MEQVFISYSRRDLAFVKRLSADLQAAGLQVWYDLSGLEAGTRWSKEIQNALRQSQYFLVVLSPNSVESEWVEREFIYASNQKLKIVPLLYRECELPLWSLNMHYLVLNEENYKEDLGNLLKLLGIMPQPEKPAVEVVEAPIIQPELEEPVTVPPPESRQEEENDAIAPPAVEIPVLQPQTKDIPPLISQKDQKESVPALELERKAEPDKVVEEKKSKKPVKLKLVPGVIEHKRAVARPGVKKAWALGVGGLGVVILLVLGIIFFGGDIKTALFPEKATDSLSPTQPLVETSATMTLTTTPAETVPTIMLIDSDSIRQADGMEMIYVPASEFTMGSDTGSEDERPAHLVYVDSYLIDQTEVTNGMYTKCVQAGECLTPTEVGSSTRSNYYDNPLYADYPVLIPSWSLASTYCYWVGGRLPTEAEWEKTASGLGDMSYPWGNDAPTCSLGNFSAGGKTCVGDTSPVGLYPGGASYHGLMDMAGNVWEWTADYYGEYPDARVRNPKGPDWGMGRVIRGGSWSSDEMGIRSTVRKAYMGETTNDIGFRCAVSANKTITTEAEVTPSATAGSEITTSISPIDGMPMVHVPEGEFSMGSDEYKDSQPVHTVYLDEFWIDLTEVTNGMYELCVSAGDCDTPEILEDSTRPDYFNSTFYTNYPVIQVDWNDAQAYCEWTGRRLPTEAEWEKAARGTDGRRYPWGGTDFSCELAIYNPGSYSNGCGGVKGTNKVGSAPGGASPYGALDMVGNVAEWVADWYSATYYSESPAANPTGPTSGEDRVLRGSSFRNIKLYLTTFYRRWSAPYGIGDDIGFRCASSTAP